jgi:hypothetical protein
MSGEARRKLIIHYYSSQHTMEEQSITGVGPSPTENFLGNEKRNFITDIAQWKRSIPLYHNTAFI